MIIVGITGPIGHGKTTFGNALGDQAPAVCHFESSSIISEVANAMHAQLRTIPDVQDLASINQWLRALPPIIDKVVHASIDFRALEILPQNLRDNPTEYQKLLLHIENLRSQPQLVSQEITPENKNVYRPFLQWLGGYLPQISDPGLWYKEVVRRIQQAQQDGCEFCIVGGVRYPIDADILRGAGGKVIKVYRPNHLEEDTQDPTERERVAIQVDSTVISNGTVEDLQQCASRIYPDLQNNQLKTEYKTA